jgi:hypothetical protein
MLGLASGKQFARQLRCAWQRANKRGRPTAVPERRIVAALLARRASVHVDFHADANFGNLRGLPSHLSSPSGVVILPTYRRPHFVVTLCPLSKSRMARFRRSMAEGCGRCRPKQKVLPEGSGHRTRVRRESSSRNRFVVAAAGQQLSSGHGPGSSTVPSSQPQSGRICTQRSTRHKRRSGKGTAEKEGRIRAPKYRERVGRFLPKRKVPLRGSGTA